MNIRGVFILNFILSLNTLVFSVFMRSFPWLFYQKQFYHSFWYGQYSLSVVLFAWSFVVVVVYCFFSYVYASSLYKNLCLKVCDKIFDSFKWNSKHWQIWIPNFFIIHTYFKISTVKCPHSSIIFIIHEFLSLFVTLTQTIIVNNKKNNNILSLIVANFPWDVTFIHKPVSPPPPLCP